MESMDKGLTVPKWVLINLPKIPQMPQNLSAQIVCLSPIVGNFHERRLHWASVVHGLTHMLHLNPRFLGTVDGPEFLKKYHYVNGKEASTKFKWPSKLETGFQFPT